MAPCVADVVRAVLLCHVFGLEPTGAARVVVASGGANASVALCPAQEAKEASRVAATAASLLWRETESTGEWNSTALLHTSVKTLVDGGVLAASDLEAFESWLIALHQLGYEFPPGLRKQQNRPSEPPARATSLDFPTALAKLHSNSSKTLELMVRTYAGKNSTMHWFMLPALRLFVDRDRVDFLFVLDDESPRDHAFGEFLFAKYGYRSAFEPVPPEMPYMAWQGYARQNWATAYWDHYSDADIIGGVDTDLTLFGLVTLDDVIAPDGSGRVMIRSSAWAKLGARKHILRASPRIVAFPPPHNVFGIPAMESELFPFYFRRSTFAAARQRCARVNNVKSYDEAWRIHQPPAFGASQVVANFNVLSNSAYLEEPDKYVWYVWDGSTPLPRVGSHLDGWFIMAGGWKRFADLPTNMGTGCCLTFGLRCDRALAAALAAYDASRGNATAFSFLPTHFSWQALLFGWRNPLEMSPSVVHAVVTSYLASARAWLRDMRPSIRSAMERECASWALAPDAVTHGPGRL